jgi:hypothetical protein
MKSEEQSEKEKNGKKCDNTLPYDNWLRAAFVGFFLLLQKYRFGVFTTFNLTWWNKIKYQLVEKAKEP